MKNCPECGAVFAKPRSIRDHNRFFGILERAFDQWPEGHEFRPTSPAHLRAWVLCKAGYHTVEMVDVDFESFARYHDMGNAGPALMKLIGAVAATTARVALGDGDYAFTRIHGEGIAVFKPKSIAFDKLSQSEFGPLRSAVEEIIEQAIGVSAEELLTARAA